MKKDVLMHFARTIPFEELYHGLVENVEKGAVSRKISKEFPELELFNYTDKCTHDRMWNPFTRVARGLVLDVVAKEVVATPFPKFFNYEEALALGEQVPVDLPFDTTEKLDGSLGIIYFHKGNWRVNTRGSFDSAQAVRAKEMLDAGPSIPEDYVGHTFLAEIIYEANRQVVSYDKQGLFLISGYDANGHELSKEEVLKLSGEPNVFKSINRFNFSNVCVAKDVLSSMDGTKQEGFVVRFDNGFRVKLVCDDFKKLHHVVAQTTPLGIWNLLKDQEDVESKLSFAPQHIKDRAIELSKTLYASFSEKLNELEKLYRFTESDSNKDIGLAMPNHLATYGDIAKLIFAYRAGNVPKVHETIWKMVRPHGNIIAE